MTARLAMLWLATLILVAATGAPVATIAGQATPAPAAQPAPAPCRARPVSPAELVAILRARALEDPDAAAPRGDAVPPAERSAIGELAGHWVSCLASGDVPALLGLFTPDGIRRLLGERSPVIGGPAGVRISLLNVANVERLRDGRIAAWIIFDPSGAGTATPETLLLIAEQGEGGWRIDHLRAPEGPVGAAGAVTGDPFAAERPLLRRPIAPGPTVPIQAPGPTVPMLGADVARTGTQLGPAPDSAPGEMWETPAGWHSDAQPIAARGLVTFGGFSLGDRLPLLVAVDAATGGVRWQTTAPVAWATIPATPALGGDIVFAPVEAPVAGVMAVAAASGEPLWFAPFGFTSVTAPAVDADAVYVAGWGVRNARDRSVNDTAGAVFALDQRTGRERWRFLTAARFGTVSVGPESIYVPSERGLFALDRATGGKRWQARFSPGTGEMAVVARDTVVFAGLEITSGRTGVFALDAASGALRWRVDVPASPGTRAGAAAANDTVYVSSWTAQADSGDGTPSLRAYDIVSGQERWVFAASGDGSAEQPVGTGSITAPVVVGRSVLVGVVVRVPASGGTGNADGLYAVDSVTGTLQWRAIGGAPIRSAPAVLDGVAYAMGGLRARGGATGGNLMAFGVE
jgi:outer membrane protein assembly factor BamB